jgi:hypothetical protein
MTGSSNPYDAPSADDRSDKTGTELLAQPISGGRKLWVAFVVVFFAAGALPAHSPAAIMVSGSVILAWAIWYMWPQGT